jgi:hypothetical protein
MNVISEGLNPGRKALWIRQYVSLRVSIDLPAVVDNEVDVTGIAHAARDHRIRHFLDELLAYVAGELVPTVPTHWRRFGKAVVVGLNISETKEKEQKRGNA